jgi:hypothetical protein
MHAKHESCRAVGENRLEISHASPIRRPYLDESGACTSNDLGDSHAATDLD